MKIKKSKEKQKNKTKIYLLVASVPLTSTETFEIQDYSNASLLAACILKMNWWDPST
jgi:hypothetical protein